MLDTQNIVNIIFLYYIIVGMDGY